jgi:DNA helicase-2/ATP-dependent DNA helicase PcrA
MKPLEDSSPAQAIIEDEQRLLTRVTTALSELSAANGADAQGAAPRGAPDYDEALIALRDQMAEAKPEDLPALVEQMTRTAAIAQRYGKGRDLPVDPTSPYFAHMRLDERGKVRDVLIGKRGFIDRARKVQIVDWRNAPVSRIYYRYEEGDDYEEHFGPRLVEGLVTARRAVTIDNARLRRIGCPQGTFATTEEGTWVEAKPVGAPTLAGGQGKAARPPAKLRSGSTKSKLGIHSGGALRADKHLPEIAALIDPQQFDLITKPDSGLVVLQGGAGTGKTTVALHRVAYLNYQQPKRFRADRMLVVVPSQALCSYVQRVLPGLGVNGVRVLTSEQWFERTRQKLLKRLGRVSYADDTPSTVLRFKKHPLMLELLRGYVERQLRSTQDELRETLQGLEGADKLLAEWQRLRERAPIPRLLALRGFANRQPELPAVTRQTVDSLCRKLLRRAADLVGCWADALTDRELLGQAVERHCPGEFSGRHLDAVVAWCAKQANLATPDDGDETGEPSGDNGRGGRDHGRGGKGRGGKGRGRNGRGDDRRHPSQQLSLLDEEREGHYVGADGRAIVDDDGERGRLDRPDDALLLYLCVLQRGELSAPSVSALDYQHLVVDEAQDLAVVELKVLLEATSEARCVTLAGDTAQRLVFDNAFSDWESLLERLEMPAATNTTLELGYRSTGEVMALANSLLGKAAPTDDKAAMPTRSGAPVELHRFAVQGEAVAMLGEALRSLTLREPLASVALIARHRAQATIYAEALKLAEVAVRLVARQDFSFRPGVEITDVAQVKGLEFDYVVLLDVTAGNYPDTMESRHLLHIAATRAAHQLWLLAVGTPSPMLPATL